MNNSVFTVRQRDKPSSALNGEVEAPTLSRRDRSSVLGETIDDYNLPINMRTLNCPGNIGFKSATPD